jgi:hypothetical protein
MSSSQDNAVALLLACARPYMDDKQAAQLRALASDADWPLLASLAENHDVVPTAYTNLSTACPDLIPADLLAGWRAWQRANSLRALNQTRELLRISRALEWQEIACLPYKGPVLAEMAYGDAALRHSVDIDILVEPSVVPAVTETIARLGYRMTNECSRHESAYRHVHHHYAFEKAANNMLLEVHWRLVTRQFCLNLSVSDLLQRSTALPLLGQSLRCPAREDMLLMVCVHGAMHGWKQIKQVCDVAAFALRRPDCDWDVLVERSGQRGVLRMLLLGFSLAGSLLDAPVPDAIADALAAEPEVAALSSEISQRLLQGRPPREVDDARTFAGYHARLRERRRDRIEQALRRAVIPNMEEWAALPLPEALSFVHYIVRPLRLGRRGMSSLWRRLRRRQSPR